MKGRNGLGNILLRFSREMFLNHWVKMTPMLELFVCWLVVASLVAFVLFGIDKWRAKRGQTLRISEFSLLLCSALGGAIGGLLGIIVFRHKSAKPMFLLKFTVALLGFFILCGVAVRFFGER